MKLTANRPYSDPEVAAKRLLEIAKEVSPMQDGRIYIELINGPFLFRYRGSAAEYGAGRRLLIERKQLEKHESGTYVRLVEETPSSRSRIHRRPNLCCFPQYLSPGGKIASLEG